MWQGFVHGAPEKPCRITFDRALLKFFDGLFLGGSNVCFRQYMNVDVNVLL